MAIDHVLHGLYSLLLLRKAIEINEDEPPAVIIFGMACAIVAILVMVVEVCVFQIFGRSMLRLRPHKVRYTSLLFLTMPLACAITGMLALQLDIVQPSISGCIAAGFSWPAIVNLLTGRSVEGEQPQLDPPGPDEGEDL